MSFSPGGAEADAGHCVSNRSVHTGGLGNSYLLQQLTHDDSRRAGDFCGDILYGAHIAGIPWRKWKFPVLIIQIVFYGFHLAAEIADLFSSFFQAEHFPPDTLLK